jgi:hypothetical protein
VELVLAKKDQLINNKNLLKLLDHIKTVQISFLETSHYQVLAKWISQASLKK